MATFTTYDLRHDVKTLCHKNKSTVRLKKEGLCETYRTWKFEVQICSNIKFIKAFINFIKAHNNKFEYKFSNIAFYSRFHNYHNFSINNEFAKLIYN